MTAAVGLGVTACSSGDGDSKSPSGGAKTDSTSTSSAAPTTPTATPKPKPTLPGGGRTIFPQHRLVGYCGLPGAPALGQLGIDPFDKQVKAMLETVKKYDDGTAKPLPVMELISTVVHPRPGRDGMFRERIDSATIDLWSKTAKDNGALLLIDIQPGLASFLDEAKAYEKWLLEPHVGLALDPEWAVLPGQIPGRVFGRTTGAKVNEVAKYVSDLVAKHDLPEKALVVHVLNKQILRQEEGLKEHPGVALIKSVDGIGPKSDKIKTYTKVMEGTKPYFHAGFKIFYQEDTAGGAPLMTPAEVLALTPKPKYVMYE